MLSDLIGFVWDIIKEIFGFIWEIVSEVASLLIKDFWEVLIIIAAIGALWYFGGGYDKAEQDYATQQKKTDESVQVQQQLEQQKAQNPNQGIYIIK